MLDILKQKYDTISLSIEEVDQKYNNYQQRVHRKSFYLRNGFKEMNFKIKEDHQCYEMLYYGKTFQPQQYDDLMFYFMGEDYSTFRNFD